MIKIILNKLIFIVIIFNLFIYNSFADEAICEKWCKIKDGAPEVILEYISNNNKIIQNISKNLWKNKNHWNISIPTNVSVWQSYQNIINQNNEVWYMNINNSVSSWIGLRIYNSLFNWSETASWFKYFLSNIDWDVPYPIKRDLELIGRQNQKLNYFLSRVIKNWYSFNDINSKKACEWIEDNWKCEKLIWNDIEEAIKNLIDNNNTINLIIRKELWFMWFNSVVWSSSYNELFAIPETFKSEIQLNYNKETYRSCANCKSWSIQRIKKSIEKISLSDRAWKDWINEWENAWNLLLWINNYDDKEKQRRIERNLLNRELARQWVSFNSWEAVLNDLENFKWNSFWFSAWNNPITNSFMNFIDEIKEPFTSRTVNSFTETLANIKENASNIDVFTFSEIIHSKENLWNDKKTFNKIQEVVKKNQAIIARQNKNTDKLQSKIIQLHINLNETINTLEDIIPKTEKICNDQDYGDGKCSY